MLQTQYKAGKTEMRRDESPNGYGSKLNHQGTTGLSPWFHLPRFHFGYLFWSHSQMVSFALVRGLTTTALVGQN